jgi:ataxia telangiectasia mutated family protein
MARFILKLLKNDPKMSEIVKSMELLADAYMEIALLPVARDKLTPSAVKDGIPFERKLNLPRLEAMPNVPIMTHDLPIEVTGNYSDFISINGFSHRFKVAGGINLPRIIECQGSDGRWYTQLVILIIILLVLQLSYILTSVY